MSIVYHRVGGATSVMPGGPPSSVGKGWVSAVFVRADVIEEAN